MREQVRDRGRLEHILQAIDKVFEFTKDVKREDFKKDSILYFAIVKNIEIIGEASYMLSLDFKDAHPDTLESHSSNETFSGSWLLPGGSRRSLERY